MWDEKIFVYESLRIYIFSFNRGNSKVWEERVREVRREIKRKVLEVKRGEGWSG